MYIAVMFGLSLQVSHDVTAVPEMHLSCTPHQPHPAVRTHVSLSFKAVHSEQHVPDATWSVALHVVVAGVHAPSHQ